MIEIHEWWEVNWGNTNAISAGLTTIFFASMVTIYNDFDISPFMLTLVFPVMFSGQKKKKKICKRSVKFFSHSFRSQNGAEREKSVAFKRYYLANDSSHHMTVLKLIRRSKHPQKRQRGFLMPQLCLCSLHMFSNIISCLLSDSSLNKGLLVHIVPIFLLRL